MKDTMVAEQREASLEKIADGDEPDLGIIDVFANVEVVILFILRGANDQGREAGWLCPRFRLVLEVKAPPGGVAANAEVTQGGTSLVEDLHRDAGLLET